MIDETVKGPLGRIKYQTQRYPFPTASAPLPAGGPATRLWFPRPMQSWMSALWAAIPASPPPVSRRGRGAQLRERRGNRSVRQRKGGDAARRK